MATYHTEISSSAQGGWHTSLPWAFSISGLLSSIVELGMLGDQGFSVHRQTVPGLGHHQEQFPLVVQHLPSELPTLNPSHG